MKIQGSSTHIPVLPSSRPASPVGVAPSAPAPARADTFVARGAPRGPEGARVGGAASEADRQRVTLAAAEHLFTAMRGGVWGLGTDEKALFDALEGVPPEDLDLVRAHYRAHYGRDLDKDVRGELSGADRQRASSLLLGQAVMADAVALRDALRGMRKDKGLAFAVLERAAQSHGVEPLQVAFREAHGEELDARIARGLSGHELGRAQALLAGDLQGARVCLVAGLLDGGRTKTRDATLLRVLQEGGPELAKLFAAREGKDLRHALEHALPPLVAQQAAAVLDQDGVTARAVGLQRVLEGKTGFDPVDALEALLAGTTAAERDQVAARFAERAGQPLDAALHHLREDATAAGRELLRTGTLKLSTRLHAARKDAELSVALLSEVPAGALPALQADYQRQYGKTLEQGLTSALDGLDRLRVGQALRGPPANLEDAVGRLREQQELLRGGWTNAGSRVAMDWLVLSRKGRQLDDTVQRAEATLERAKADGVITPEEHAEVTALVRYGAADADSHRDAVNRVARVSSGIAGSVASSVAVAATGGAATPLLVQIAAASLAGGAASGAAAAVVTGRAYTLHKLREDFGLGALDGGSMVLGSVVAKGLSQGISNLVVDRFLDGYGVSREGRTQLARSLVADWFVNSKQVGRVGYRVGMAAVSSGVSSGTSGLVRTAVQADTWTEGGAQGMRRIMAGALKGLASGTLNGSAGALIAMALNGVHQVSLLPEADAKALTHNVQVDTPHGPVNVMVMGDMTDKGLQDVRKGLEQISAATGGKGVEGLQFVYVFDMGDRILGVCAGENGFALATDYANRGLSVPVAFHEDAHRLDNLLVGMKSLNVPSPFGKPPFHSDYAKTKLVEDVAETHERFMLELTSKGTVDLNPVTNPFAEKYQWLLDNFYPELEIH